MSLIRYILISIHAPHTGRDHTVHGYQSFQFDFNPRAPYGARLSCSLTASISRLFQSTRPIRGATQVCNNFCVNLVISIHAPHTGRDLIPSVPCPYSTQFQSTRPIRGATLLSGLLTIWTRFQSTRPIRGATFFKRLFGIHEEFQSTRPIRGATTKTIM